jgi:hypothetical protein
MKKRKNLWKTIKVVGCITPGLIVCALVLFVLRGCYSRGYESGKEAGIEQAKSDAEKKYEAEISGLKSKLNGTKAGYEKKLQAMNKSHATRIDGMKNQHTGQLDEMKSAHTALLVEMRKAQNQKLKQTMEENFRKGQADMTRRITDMIDLDTENKPAKTGWDDTHYTIKKQDQ